MTLRNIICLSGGLASAWVAYWARNLPDVVYYFNDTKWEHPDLYRFLDDLERVLGISITRDSDGRSPEEVFYDERHLANNRVPLCSKILKAQRLQQFVQPGDICHFGIDETEAHRAIRIKEVYAPLGVECRFPLIETGTTKAQVRGLILGDLAIVEPELYRMGFTHNNCGGGCVRAGRRQWALLLEKQPATFAERERVESDLAVYLGRRATYMKDESLTELRERIQAQGMMDFGDEDRTSTECIGICTLEN